jgi:hypothetical protein
MHHLLQHWKNFAFCPHIMLDFFIRSWQKSEIIPLNSINGLDFIMWKQCVSCEIGAEYLSNIHKKFMLQTVTCLLMAIMFSVLRARSETFCFQLLVPSVSPPWIQSIRREKNADPILQFPPEIVHNETKTAVRSYTIHANSEWVTLSLWLLKQLFLLKYSPVLRVMFNLFGKYQPIQHLINRKVFKK